MKYKIKINKNILNRTKQKKADLLAVLLEIYIYFSFIWLILSRIFHLHAIFHYVFFGGIIGCALLCTKRINIGAILFLLVFLMLVIINIATVSYPYYVFIESMEAFTGIIVPIVIIGSKDFDITVFVDRWIEFAKKNFILVFISIMLFKLDWVNYSIFAGICVPNTFILSFCILSNGRQQNKNLTLLILMNISAVVLWGGRMAAVTAICMYIIAYLFSEKNRSWKKVIFVLCLGIIVILLYFNIGSILIWMNKVLSSLGIESRSIQLLLNQLKSGKVYVTNRDLIYSKCIEYIRMRKGLPGGFGVVLYLTDGQFYFAHNIILQLLVQFGFLGTIILFFILMFKINAIKGRTSLLERKLIYFLLVSFGMLSMTGASIWTHYMSTTALAILFFYKADKVKAV